MARKTIEVEVDPSGYVRALKPSVSVPAGPALLTPLGMQRIASPAQPLPGGADWRALVGTLRDSPNWRDDPQTVQHTLRDEWH